MYVLLYVYVCYITTFSNIYGLQKITDSIVGHKTTCICLKSYSNCGKKKLKGGEKGGAIPPPPPIFLTRGLIPPLPISLKIATPRQRIRIKA